MIAGWRGSVTKHLAAQLAEPRGVWGRLTGAMMNLVNADINRHAVELLGVSSRHRVLEIGFGGGKNLARLLRLASAGSVAGIERSATMVQAARAAHSAAISRGRLTIADGDASSLPWEDASFDRMLTVNTLYFLPDPAVALTEMRRVLKADGKCIIAYRPKALMDRLPVTAHGFRTFTDDEVLSLLHDAKLEVTGMTFGGKHGQEHRCVEATPL